MKNARIPRRVDQTMSLHLAPRVFRTRFCSQACTNLCGHGATGASMKFFAADDGALAVEYALLLALVAVACTTAIRSIGGALNAPFGSVATKLGDRHASTNPSSQSSSAAPGLGSQFNRIRSTSSHRLTPLQMVVTVLIIRPGILDAMRCLRDISSFNPGAGSRSTSRPGERSQVPLQENRLKRSPAAHPGRPPDGAANHVRGGQVCPLPVPPGR
jgi:Flp pilus assembly pilin Flp